MCSLKSLSCRRWLWGVLAARAFVAPMAGEAVAQTHFYVDCGSGGSDVNNSGTTKSSPWKTLGHAAMQATDGYTIVHVKGGICGESNVHLARSGPPATCDTDESSCVSCREDDTKCFIWQGESPCFCGGDPGCTLGCASPTEIRNGSSSADDGILIEGSHVKFSNFTITHGPQSIYDVAFSTHGQSMQPVDDVLVENVSVTSAATKGIAVLQSSNVLVRGGTVSGCVNYAYGAHGEALPAPTPALNSRNVVFQGTTASSSSPGYEIDHRTLNVTFDGAKATNNLTHGFMIKSDLPDANDLPDPNEFPAEPRIKLLGVVATDNGSGANGGNGIYSLAEPLYVENAYIHSNKLSGIDVREGGGFDADEPTDVTIVGSTIRDNQVNGVNGFAQIAINRRNANVVIADSIISTSAPASAVKGLGLLYYKRDDTRVRWSNSVISRVETNQNLVTYVNSDNVPRSCTIGAGIGRCDAVGDCDSSLAVSSTELAQGRDISFGTSALTTCRQFDGNGDGKVTVEERLTATTTSAGGVARPNVVTAQPVFVNGMRLSSTSPGANQGLLPSDAPDLAGAAICRADACDHEGKTRVGVGSGYDMGAFEGDGTQSTAGCAFSPGGCVLPPDPIPNVIVDVMDRNVCPNIGSIAVPVAVRAAPTGLMSGLQIDLGYNPSELTFQSCTSQLTGFSVDAQSIANGKVRVMLGDFDASHVARLTFDNTEGAFYCNFSRSVSYGAISASNVVVGTRDGNRLAAVGLNGAINVVSCCSGCC